ncbi:MAG: DUF4129 domain-containing protein [Anaerolineaceae bacterium]|nr:DUF4129 domain-containing protein [Anaerolineaceae bacterium]
MRFQQMVPDKEYLRYGSWSELANFSRMVMELILAASWYVSLTSSFPKWYPGFFFLGLSYLISHFLVRVLQNSELKMSIQRLVFSLWMLLDILAGLRMLLPADGPLTIIDMVKQIYIILLPESDLVGFWIILFILLLGIRGIATARKQMTARDTLDGFRINLLLFIIYAAIFGRQMPQIALASFFSFLFFALIALSLARIADISGSHGGKIPALGKQWTMGIFGITAGIILISILMVLIFNFEVADFLASGLVLLVQIFSGILILLATPILYVVLAIVQFIYDLMGLRVLEDLENVQINTGAVLIEQFDDQISRGTDLAPRTILMAGVFLILVIIALVLLRRSNRRRMYRGEDGIYEITEKTPITNPLKNLFRNILRFRQRTSARSIFAAARVRRIYAQLMDQCKRLGKPRPRSQTPFEFLPKMESLYPENMDDLTLITEAYVKVRYGQLPETSKDIDDVLAAWERVKGYGKLQLDDRMRKLRGSG